LILAIAGNIVWVYRDLILELITVYGVLGVVAITGILLYYLRARYRLIYGVAETIVGYLTVAKIVFPEVDIHEIDTAQGLGILGGLYIIVRGLDNVGKGLEKTPYKDRWRRYSGETGP
jgi:hypothetical protein